MGVTESTIRNWAQTWHVDPDDALQEYRLWHLTGQQWKPETLRHHITSQTCARRYSLDAPCPIGDDEADTWADHVPAPARRRDETLRRVWKTLRYWELSGVLTRTQRCLLWLVYAEEQSLAGIARLAGCHHTTLVHHHRRALERIRDRVAAHAWTGADSRS